MISLLSECTRADVGDKADVPDDVACSLELGTDYMHGGVGVLCRDAS